MIMDNFHEIAINHISVENVVLGMADNSLYVLLVKRTMTENGVTVSDFRLPGALVKVDEDLDVAAKRVLTELTGPHNLSLIQFKTFGARKQFSTRDYAWLNHYRQVDILSLVSVGYIAMGRIGRKFNLNNAGYHACWIHLNEALKLPLAFDHNTILAEAIEAVRIRAEINPEILFKMLPPKFTALQLRVLYELIYDKRLDVRNFKKKMKQLSYIEPLNEFEQGVSHRAAQFYRFNRVQYRKFRRGTN